MLPQNARRHLLTIAAALTGVLLLGGTALADAHHPFDDTVGTSYEEPVAQLWQEGLVLGCDENAFCPNDTLTRAQAASLIARATGLDSNGTDADTVSLPDADLALADESPADEFVFADVDEDGAHTQNIVAIAEAGITVGCDEENFCPNDLLTRAQLTTLLFRGFNVGDSSVRAFDDVDGVHREAVDAFAMAGYASGCTERLTDFCPNGEVPRWQAAVMLARVLGLAETVELEPLEERRAQQAELDEQERLRIEAEEEAARQAAAEEEAARQAAAEAEQYPTNRLATWEALAQCESGGNWSINTGNGYYGGLQFALATWRSVGGSGYPHQASKAEQIRRGEILQQRAGWGQWPACSRKLGLR